MAHADFTEQYRPCVRQLLSRPATFTVLDAFEGWFWWDCLEQPFFVAQHDDSEDRIARLATQASLVVFDHKSLGTGYLPAYLVLRAKSSFISLQA